MGEEKLPLGAARPLGIAQKELAREYEDNFLF